MLMGVLVVLVELVAVLVIVLVLVLVCVLVLILLAAGATQSQILASVLGLSNPLHRLLVSRSASMKALLETQ